ncbi:type II toxin-antitoxin system Phd/YefM family antitoxin [Myxosarcina sp. GI1]|uniref:type II toxin-antitoxin system Phd/YefM family antitoxin n=1 Tax=Myxosarcina sp. GI1 TaxID=1541065 RepID=UPI00055EC7BD|nr:type II toxin-antitoxin system prevent-host-death family antitoxin [Myxosarcina sp. GI1]
MNEPINIHEAKTQLSKLLSRVALGEEFTIANRGVPVAKLVPYHPSKDESEKPTAWLTLRVPGRLTNQIYISDDFNELDKEMMGLFYGEE